MQPNERREPSPMGGFAVVAVALVGLALGLVPWVERIDNALLDAQWSMLRKFDHRASASEIVIVGVDERSARSIAAPPEMWHEALGMALVRLASAKPRAIGVDLVLPERSYDDVRPGLDRALLVGLAAARDNGPLVASLAIDARTRSARAIHPPFLAVLGEQGLGIGLLARDADGVTRRFSLAIPTEDGSFPTFAGRLCGTLSKGCEDGLVNFSLGEPFRYVSLRQLLDTRDVAILQKLFRDRVVLLGEIRGFGNRISVPANLAGWESNPRDSPAIVVHAQSLRTALHRAAPQEASKPWVALLAAFAALLVLVRQPLYAALLGILAASALFIAACVALHGGIYLPVAGALLTLLVAWLARAGWTFSRTFELRRRG